MHVKRLPFQKPPQPQRRENSVSFLIVWSLVSTEAPAVLGLRPMMRPTGPASATLRESHRRSVPLFENSASSQMGSGGRILIASPAPSLPAQSDRYHVSRGAPEAPRPHPGNDGSRRSCSGTLAAPPCIRPAPSRVRRPRRSSWLVLAVRLVQVTQHRLGLVAFGEHLEQL